MNTIFRLFLYEKRGWPANGILVQLFSRCGCFRWSYRVRHPTSTRIYRKLEAALYRWGCTLIYAKYRSVHFYLAQGIPTVLLGVGCFFFLPDRPESTIYLTKEEQKLATDRMSRDASRDNGAFINKSKSIIIGIIDIIRISELSSRTHLGGVPGLEGRCCGLDKLFRCLWFVAIRRRHHDFWRILCPRVYLRFFANHYCYFWRLYVIPKLSWQE